MHDLAFQLVGMDSDSNSPTRNGTPSPALSTWLSTSTLSSAVTSASPSPPSSPKPGRFPVVGAEAVSIRSGVQTICCVGAGYVGGPTAAVIALQNPHIRVTVVDKDAGRIAKWNSKHLPVHEPGLYDVVRSARDGTKSTSIPLGQTCADHAQVSGRAPNLFFSTDLAYAISEADVVFLGVNTPTKMSGIGAGQATNMSALESATREIARSAKPGAIIVEKSTVPCRTAQIIRDTLETYRPGIPFEILSNPEFLAEGTAIKDLLNPDRILIGSLQTPGGLAAAAALKSVYSSWVDPSKIVTVNLWSSELAKLVANAMLAQRISSINSISAVCERTGANIDEIALSIGLDQRLGSRFLKAGIGFGGSCFKKDILSLVYLANSLELPEVGEYWNQVLEINDFQRIRFVKRIVSKLNGNLIGKKLAILGYAFKKDTNDTRESPAIDVVKQLLADSPSEIAIFDPNCKPEAVKDEIKRLFASTGSEPLKPQGPIEVYKDAYAACDGATAVIILTDCDQFRYPSLPAPPSVFRRASRAPRLRPVPPKREPSEATILELREKTKVVGGVRPAEKQCVDPFSRFENEPECVEGCRDCERAQKNEIIARENVDWSRVSYQMSEVKWVFDGRGIVEIQGLEQLGFRVEAIGVAGSRSRLNNFE